MRDVRPEVYLDTLPSNPDINSNTEGPPEIQKSRICSDDPREPLSKGVLTEVCAKGQSTMAESPEVMNIRQASEYLGVSPDTLYKYVSEERIPAFKLGNRWKFKKTILDSWMERKSSVGEGRDKKKPKSAKAAMGGQ